MAKMKRKLKKGLSLLLILSLCMSMMGMTAFAQGDGTECEHDYVVSWRNPRPLVHNPVQKCRIAVSAATNKCWKM